MAADDPLVLALVNRTLATRDRVAFGQLYDRFVDQIYRYLYAWCGNKADAEDLTEQVFVNAWKVFDQWPWQGLPFKLLLYRLAHNAHLDLDHAQPRAMLGEAPQLDPDVLAKAVRHLTPRQRRVLQLRFTADLDTREIAQIMDQQEGAIRALQMRGLKSLRRLLDEQRGVEQGGSLGFCQSRSSAET